MKTIINSLAFFLFAISLNAQAKSVSDVLIGYLKVKDALVLSNPENAALSAGELYSVINELNLESLDPKEQRSFLAVRSDLLTKLQKIHKKADLEVQRNAFAELSPLIWQLVKTSGSITRQLYYQYCPMKRAYWISIEEPIKNPYYGNKMLSCGSIAEKN